VRASVSRDVLRDGRRQLARSRGSRARPTFGCRGSLALQEARQPWTGSRRFQSSPVEPVCFDCPPLGTATMPSPRSSKRKNRRGSPTGEHIRLGGPQDDPLFEAAAAPATIRRYDVRSRSSPGSSAHPERVLVNARAPYAPVHPHPSHRRARRSSPKPPRFHRIARIAHERSSSLLLACTKGACRRAVRRGWSHEAKGLGLSCRAGSALAMPPQWALASIEPGWASRCRAVSIECWQTKPRTEEALWLPQLEEDSWLLKWRFASTSMRWLSPPSPARAEAGAVRGTAAMVLSPPLRAATPTRRGWTRPPAPE
jgi:hypothetical protein